MTSVRNWLTNAMWAVVLLVSIAVSYTVVGIWRERLTTSRMRPVATNPLFSPGDGIHLIAYVLTAADCGWSNHPSMLAAYKTIRNVLKTFHGDKYAEISVIGVALDQNLSAGFNFLASIGGGTPEGAFDQIAVGGTWLNEQIVKFVWREHAAEPATPQIVLVERPVDAGSYRETYTLKVEADSIIAVKSGADLILSWLQQGAPLPTRGITRK